jgi:hypothetical protein
MDGQAVCNEFSTLREAGSALGDVESRRENYHGFQTVFGELDERLL